MPPPLTFWVGDDLPPKTRLGLATGSPIMSEPWRLHILLSLKLYFLASSRLSTPFGAYREKLCAHGSYNVRQANFEDFSRIFQEKNDGFQGLRIILKNQHCLTPSWTVNWLKHVMKSLQFLLFQPSLHYIIYTTFRNNTLQNDWVWLAISSEVHIKIKNRSKILLIQKKKLTR